jgi:hypothetical protein
MELIQDQGIDLALIYQQERWQEGVHFLTPEKWSLQVGTWNHPIGKQLPLHKHQSTERRFDRTQEVIFVKTGKIELSIYTDNFCLVAKRVLTEGGIAVLASGAHSYQILDEETQILEIKNGPYLGDDKELPL